MDEGRREKTINSATMPKHGICRIEHTTRKEGKILEPYRDNTKRKGPGVLGGKEVAGVMKNGKGSEVKKGLGKEGVHFWKPPLLATGILSEPGVTPKSLFFSHRVFY